MIRFRSVVPGADLSRAGEASSRLKRTLRELGLSPEIIRRAAVSMYEGEINMVIHAGGGEADVEIGPERIVIMLSDHGPGIPDLELAMQEGWSTASDEIRALGFGAGMGLPNIKRYSDELEIDTAPGVGTTVRIIVRISGAQGHATPETHSEG